VNDSRSVHASLAKVPQAMAKNARGVERSQDIRACQVPAEADSSLWEKERPANDFHPSGGKKKRSKAVKAFQEEVKGRVWV
jgi:hypothetical protein